MSADRDDGGADVVDSGSVPRRAGPTDPQVRRARVPASAGSMVGSVRPESLRHRTVDGGRRGARRLLDVPGSPAMDGGMRDGRMRVREVARVPGSTWTAAGARPADRVIEESSCERVGFVSRLWRCGVWLG
jgi:hypothetical protein